MREILSKHDMRQLILLEFLVKNKQNWLLLKDISDCLKIPIRTVHSDISEINMYIKPVYIKSSSSGVKIYIPPNYSERYLYKKILEESREFRLIELIFVGRNETIESLSDKLYISESTVKRMVKEINNAFRNEGFLISGKPLAISGNERKLIQFMSFYFRERYLVQEEYMTDAQIELLNQLINSILTDVGKETYFPNFKRISLWVYLCCVRLSNQHYIPVENPKKQFPVKILNNKEFCDKFHEIMGVYLIDETVKQLFYVYSNENYAFNIEELHRLIQSDNAQRALYQDIQRALNSLSVQLDIPLYQSTEGKLLLDVMNIINMKHISGSYTFILYDRREYFLSDLSVYYINLRELIKNNLKENISLDFVENEWNELNYILLTHWPELYRKIRFIEAPTKVFLLVDTDIEHGQLIKNELETYSRYHIEVENIMNYSPEQMSSLSPDSVLVTNIPGIPGLRCATLCFGEFLDSRDWQEFNRLVDNILSNRKISAGTRKGV